MAALAFGAFGCAGQEVQPPQLRQPTPLGGGPAEQPRGPCPMHGDCPAHERCPMADGGACPMMTDGGECGCPMRQDGGPSRGH